MSALLDRLGDLVLVIGARLLLLLAVLVVLVIAERVIVAVAARLVRGAAAAPVPGEADLPAEEREVRRAARARRLDTLALVATRITRVGLVLLGVLAAAGILLPELIAALGSLGVAVGVAVGGALGFGAQQLVRDYLNGILILGENPFSVGDVVAIAGVRGTVEEVGLRRTIVHDVDGTIHSIPNSEILVASNFTRTYARVNERFAVSPAADIERAVEALAGACVALAADPGWADRFVEAPRVLRVDAPVAGEPGIPILVRAMVRPGEQWEVAGEVRRRCLDALRGAGVDLAAGRMIVHGGPAAPAAPPPAGPGSVAEDG